MKVISLGWGTQSFTLAAMVALAELEPVDAVIHADTMHEVSGTYAFAAKWMPWLEAHGVKVVTVRPIGGRTSPLDNYNSVTIPAFTASSDKGGQLRRQCTHDWKILPIRRWLQANRDKQPVEMWIGISLDEASRMRPSDAKYITNRWPLIEMRMSRHDCTRWLEKHGLELPPKSACYFCPYRDARAWHDMKANGNGDWQKAVAMDEFIRKGRPPYDLFLHQSRKPLTEVDFATPEERGQLSLWGDECSGMCGV